MSVCKPVMVGFDSVTCFFFFTETENVENAKSNWKLCKSSAWPPESSCLHSRQRALGLCCTWVCYGCSDIQSWKFDCFRLKYFFQCMCKGNIYPDAWSFSLYSFNIWNCKTSDSKREVQLSAHHLHSPALNIHAFSHEHRPWLYQRKHVLPGSFCFGICLLFCYLFLPGHIWQN